jgi:hypothetical protein
VTHVLLPDFVVERRRYAVEEIGQALEKAAARVSAWKVSGELGLPFATVRDWRRRCRERTRSCWRSSRSWPFRWAPKISALRTWALAALVTVLKAELVIEGHVLDQLDLSPNLRDVGHAP